MKKPLSMACMTVFLLTILMTGVGAVPGAEPSAPQFVKQLDLIHFSHTDFGFTDHPAVCRDMYRRYLDIALDAALASEKGAGSPKAQDSRSPSRTDSKEARFRWTAETTAPVLDWWQAASPQRRKQFLQALRAGQLEVTALPLNNTPFLDAAQWQAMTHWLPDELWQQFQPRSAVQNDVNGFPRAGALALLDRGVQHLFTGINTDSGGAPFARPAAFWWKMPDGRRLFVWLSLGYGDGYSFFETAEWRRGPVPLAADARFRPPRAGEILRSDEASLRAAHQQCLQRLRQVEQAGYRYPVLAVSLTNMWRYDNDPPFPPVTDFVAAWNRLGLQPRLRLTTVTEALLDLKKEAGPTAPEYEGEWTDWWANGTACAPREVAASRMAKRYLAAAQAPLWGPLDPSAQSTIRQLTQDLCLFDEHTWGSSMSVAQPFSLDAQGQFNEKARLAYRPMALAEWLLARRARSRLVPEGEGLWLANPAREAFSGWAGMTASCLRDNYQSVVDPATGAKARLYFDRGPQPWGRPQKPEDLSPEDIAATFADQAPRRFARFWVEKLEPQTSRRFRLSTEAGEEKPLPIKAVPSIQRDDRNWPTTAVWPGMNKPLFLTGLGDFEAIQVKGFAPRWILRDIWEGGVPAREKMRRQALLQVPARAVKPAQWEETPHTLRCTQYLEHPRLKTAVRRLELWKGTPRVRITFRFNRLTSVDPEIFYLLFSLPCAGTLPRLSCGGQPFTPFTDQLAGTCRDYFAIDGWAHYSTPEGNWLWVSRDAPLVALGGPQPLARLTAPPRNPDRLAAMVYNNFWYTNFLGDSTGVMEFQFDLVWRKVLDNPEKVAEGLLTEPVMVVNPGVPEHPLLLRHLYRP